MDRRIIHVDMDEFFAAVEKLDRPDLRGRCLLIGGPTRRGVVATASYEARKFGCRSAMPMSQAIRLCPQAVVLPPRHDRYQQVSERIFALLENFTPLVEPLSIDEAFLDVTASQRLLGDAPKIAADIKRAIRDQTGLTASLGLAPNKFLAKLASDLRKPDGLVIVDPRNVQAFLDPLPVRRLWGVGPAGESLFLRLGIRTVADLRQADPAVLAKAFGSDGDHFARLALGRDDRPVTTDWQAKSIGQEQTFATDLTDLDDIRAVLLDQTQEVSRRLRRIKIKTSHGVARGEAGTITLKLRYADFTTLTRSATLDAPTDLTEAIWQAARRLLDAWAAKAYQPLRLLGLSISNLTATAGQLPLFDNPARGKLKDLDQAMDRIHDRFGPAALRRGKPPE